MLLETIPFTLAFGASGASGSFVPPLVAFLVVACLLIVLVALAISRAKRDVSIDLTMLEVRK